MPPIDIKHPIIAPGGGFIEQDPAGMDRVFSMFDLASAAASMTSNKFDGKVWFDRMLALANSDDESIRLKALKEVRSALRENLTLGGFIQTGSSQLSARDKHGNEVSIACQTQSLITSMKERPDVSYPNGAAPRVLAPSNPALDQAQPQAAEPAAPSAGGGTDSPAESSVSGVGGGKPGGPPPHGDGEGQPEAPRDP